MPESALDLVKSVLIVDQSEDNREVLRTALGKRGIQILEAAEACQGLELARQCHPELIILDMEHESDVGTRIHDEFDAESKRQNSSLLILGRLAHTTNSSQHRVVSKPYHYGPLIRTIEQMVAESN